MKLFHEISIVLGLLSKGAFALAFYRIGRHVPSSLFVYNKAFLLTAPPEEVRCRPKKTSNSRVVEVGANDIGAIAQVSRFTPERIEKLLASGARCYLGAVPGEEYTSVVWTAGRKCYIRGMGFEFEFGPDDLYVFGMTRRPEGPVGLGRLVFTTVLQEAIENGVKTMYSLVEFSNANALNLHRKMGYTAILRVHYIKLFGIRICRRTDMSSGQTESSVFIREPLEGATII